MHGNMDKKFLEVLRNQILSELLNGNMTINQSNKTVQGLYVSSGSEANIKVDLRKGDFDFITKNATLVSTFWFIDKRTILALELILRM